MTPRTPLRPSSWSWPAAPDRSAGETRRRAGSMAWPAGSRREPGATTPGAASMSGGGRRWPRDTRRRRWSPTPARGFTRRSTPCRRSTGPPSYSVTSKACRTSRPRTVSVARCEPSRAGSSGRKNGSASVWRGAGASLPAVLPPLANAVAPSAAWVKTTAEAARAFAAGQAALAQPASPSATVSLARSTIRAAVYRPEADRRRAPDGGLCRPRRRGRTGRVPDRSAPCSLDKPASPRSWPPGRRRTRITGRWSCRSSIAIPGRRSRAPR